MEIAVDISISTLGEFFEHFQKETNCAQFPEETLLQTLILVNLTPELDGSGLVNSCHNKANVNGKYSF